VLVHIGYPKTATTWIQEFLFQPEAGMRWLGKKGRRHPVRQLVRVLPFQFDAGAFRARFEPLLKAVESEGLLPVVSFERLSGHPFSGGYDAKELSARLKDVFPDAGVLIVIREQRSMILSTYKWYVAKGGPSSLRGFLKSPRSGDRRVPWFDMQHFEYHHLIDHYRQLFGTEAVQVLAYEQFLRDPQWFVADVARFSGVDIDAELLRSLPYRERTNTASSAARIAVQRRANHFVGRAEFNPATFFRSRLAQRAGRGAIDHLPLERITPSAFEARTERNLRRLAFALVGDRYRESNRITQELTGIDLGAYGWAI
jgi:hypothetical protein